MGDKMSYQTFLDRIAKAMNLADLNVLKAELAKNTVLTVDEKAKLTTAITDRTAKLPRM